MAIMSKGGSGKHTEIVGSKSNGGSSMAVKSNAATGKHTEIAGRKGAKSTKGGGAC